MHTREGRKEGEDRSQKYRKGEEEGKTLRGKTKRLWKEAMNKEKNKEKNNTLKEQQVKDGPRKRMEG